MKPGVSVAWAAVLGAAALVGCSQTPPAPPAEPPTVSVSTPVEREVTDYEYFLGRTDAVDSVEVRARVTGYLDKVLFKPGTEVKKGALLVQIDPRPYQAALDKALGQVALYEAALKRGNADVNRNRPLVKNGAVSQQDLDKYVADRDEAAASVEAARA